VKDFTFYTGSGTLLAHELDSGLDHGWRVIPVVRGLADETGSINFIVAHMPVPALLVAPVASKNSRSRLMTRTGTGLFLVIHGLLHISFKDHPAYEFRACSRMRLFSAVQY
jgi:hypothetical protein